MFDSEIPHRPPRTDGTGEPCLSIISQIERLLPLPRADSLIDLLCTSPWQAMQRARGDRNLAALDLIFDGCPVHSIRVVAADRTQKDLSKALGLGRTFQQVDRSGCGVGRFGRRLVVLSMAETPEEHHALATLMLAPRAAATLLMPPPKRRFLGVSGIRQLLKGNLAVGRAALGGVRAIYKLEESWLVGFESRSLGLSGTVWLPKQHDLGKFRVSFEPDRLPQSTASALRRLSLPATLPHRSECGFCAEFLLGRGGIEMVEFTAIEPSIRRRRPL